ncbi:MAG: hypothetical protein K0S74_477 [Chlamydiales bacterium]|nr:hypothetical protein [Chlamydiales bacterium]
MKRRLFNNDDSISEIVTKSLLDLPYDMLHTIQSYLDDKSVHSLQCSCKLFFETIQSSVAQKSNKQFKAVLGMLAILYPQVLHMRSDSTKEFKQLQLLFKESIYSNLPSTLTLNERNSLRRFTVYCYKEIALSVDSKDELLPLLCLISNLMPYESKVHSTADKLKDLVKNLIEIDQTNTLDHSFSYFIEEIVEKIKNITPYPGYGIEKDFDKLKISTSSTVLAPESNFSLRSRSWDAEVYLANIQLAIQKENWELLFQGLLSKYHNKHPKEHCEGILNAIKMQKFNMAQVMIAAGIDFSKYYSQTETARFIIDFIQQISLWIRDKNLSIKRVAFILNLLSFCPDFAEVQAKSPFYSNQDPGYEQCSLNWDQLLWLYLPFKALDRMACSTKKLHCTFRSEDNFLHLLLSFAANPIHNVPIQELWEKLKMLSILEMDVNQKDVKGRTLMHLTVSFAEVEVKILVDKLLEIGADPNIPNLDGNTPLHLWCAKPKLDNIKAKKEIILTLLKHKADISYQNKEGETPLSLFIKDLIESINYDTGDEEDFKSMINLLIKAGSKLVIPLSNEKVNLYERTKNIHHCLQTLTPLELEERLGLEADKLQLAKIVFSFLLEKIEEKILETSIILSSQQSFAT